MTVIEDWKDIPGYEGLYKVSNMGRVKSLRLHVNNRLSEYISVTIGKNGYQRVHLYKNGKQHTVEIHRLVANSFVSKIDESQDEVNHVDFNKHNNFCDNLIWCRHLDNVRHTQKYSRNTFGERVPQHKLKTEEVALIRELKNFYGKELTNKVLAKIFKVQYNHILNILSYKKRRLA